MTGEGGVYVSVCVRESVSDRARGFGVFVDCEKVCVCVCVCVSVCECVSV